MNIPTPPPQRLLSNTRLNKEVNVDSKRIMEKLKYYQSSFSAQRKFWIEVAVLNRLEYKNKNQHRQFHRFKRSSEVKKKKTSPFPQKKEPFFIDLPFHALSFSLPIGTTVDQTISTTGTRQSGHTTLYPVLERSAHRTMQQKKRWHGVHNSYS